mgnify:CR=1 FL=1
MTEQEHTEIAKDLLVGRTITDVVYLSKFDCEQSLWSKRPIMIILDDDSTVIPMADDEGNDGGALHYFNPDKDITETIGVLWYD